jgi:hypothetical protein
MCRARISGLWGKITVLVMVGLCVNTAAALDGSGTEQDPWLIHTLEDFNDFAADDNYWAGFTRLETDVNLVGRVYSRAVIAWDVDKTNGYLFDGMRFTGVFDGNDHKILNLTIDDVGAGNDYLGLLGCIDEDAQIKDLGLEDSSISGDLCIGVLAGYNCGSILNCYSTGSVSGAYTVGIIVGFNDGTVSNCYSTGFVSGQRLVGGLVGFNELGSLSNCCSAGNVSGDLTIGGLLGANCGSVSYCHSKADVTGDTIGSRNFGGLVGKNLALVSNCYSTGNVSCDVDVGGLLGDNEGGNVSNCYSIGSVSGYTSVGGLVGCNELGNLSNCFWDTDTQTHGVTKSIGRNTGGTIVNVSGLPTSQLHQQSTFTDWDFINVWDIGENQTYPYLRVYLPSDINKDGIVNFLDFAITANKWLEGGLIEQLP